MNINKIIKSIFLILLSLIVFSICGLATIAFLVFDTASIDYAIETQRTSTIKSIIEFNYNKNNTLINIADILPFTWDEAYLFQINNKELVREIMGVDFDKLRVEFDCSCYSWYWCFFMNGELVYNEYINFVYDGEPLTLNPTNSFFLISPSKNNKFKLNYIGEKRKLTNKDIADAYLMYNYSDSIHHEFYTDGDYMVFLTSVSITNNYDKNLFVNVVADVHEDRGLVIEDFAPAYKKDSLKKENILLKASTTAAYTLYFKAKKGDIFEKKDRNPPKRLTFEIVEN